MLYCLKRTKMRYNQNNLFCIGSVHCYWAPSIMRVRLSFWQTLNFNFSSCIARKEKWLIFVVMVLSNTFKYSTPTLFLFGLHEYDNIAGDSGFYTQNLLNECNYFSNKLNLVIYFYVDKLSKNIIDAKEYIKH